MKMLMMNTRIAAIALVAFFVVAFTIPAHAANDSTNPSPVELKYIGKYNNLPVFQLNMTGAVGSEYTVVIRDEDGSILYRETLKGGTISKKYMLNTEELGNIDVKFEITGKDLDKAIVYEVNRNARVVEDMVVNKVK